MGLRGPPQGLHLAQGGRGVLMLSMSPKLARLSLSHYAWAKPSRGAGLLGFAYTTSCVHVLVCVSMCGGGWGRKHNNNSQDQEDR